MTRIKRAMHMPYKKMPLGGVATCPCCTFAVVVRRPLTWGDISKAKGVVWRHYNEAHPPKHEVQP